MLSGRPILNYRRWLDQHTFVEHVRVASADQPGKTGDTPGAIDRAGELPRFQVRRRSALRTKIVIVRHGRFVDRDVGRFDRWLQAVAEEKSRRGFLAFRLRRPDHRAPMSGAGDRDVEKAQRLSERFLFPDRLVFLAPDEIEREAIIFLRIVEGRAGDRVRPDIGAKDDIELEPLALVHGDNADRLFVALQTELAFFARRHISGLHFLGEPFQNAGYAQPVLDAGGMEQF